VSVWNVAADHRLRQIFQNRWFNGIGPLCIYLGLAGATILTWTAPEQTVDLPAVILSVAFVTGIRNP
jgi:hypothetical protein